MKVVYSEQFKAELRCITGRYRGAKYLGFFTRAAFGLMRSHFAMD
jgi:hypothetical protein